MAKYTYITPGQGKTSPWGYNIFINIKCLSIRSFVIKLESSMLYIKSQDPLRKCLRIDSIISVNLYKISFFELSSKYLQKIFYLA